MLSELLRNPPDLTVINWIKQQPVSQIFTTSITKAEMLYGVKILDKGARRDKLERAILDLFNIDLAERVLDFNIEAADDYSDIAARRRKAGRPISTLDAQIAAIARASGAILATRNIPSVESWDIKTVNPWEA